MPSSEDLRGLEPHVYGVKAGSDADMERQFRNAMHMAHNPTCLQKTFSSPMTARELAETQCSVTFGDCVSRCESRWRHWPNPEHGPACRALCETQLSTCTEASRTLPPRMRHCPYNEVDDNATAWRETATGADGYPWRNPNSSIASYGVGAVVQNNPDDDEPHREMVVLLVVVALLVVGALVVMRKC